MALERKEIEEKFRWKLEDIFPTDEAWEECYFATDERVPHIAKYQDK